MQFKIALVAPTFDRRTVFIKHISGLNQLWSDIPTWVSNAATMRRESKYMSVSTRYLPFPANKRINIPSIELVVVVVGDQGQLELPVYQLEPARSQSVRLNERTSFRVRYRLARRLITTDLSGRDDEFDSIIRTIISTVIKQDFS